MLTFPQVLIANIVFFLTMPADEVVQWSDGANGNGSQNVRQSLRSSSYRSRRPPQTYTPSKLSSEYTLNMQKAARKKIAATERVDNVEVTLKNKTLVMVFTPAPYELFKNGIQGYFGDCKDREFKRTVKPDNLGATVHESLAVLSKESGKKLFTVNLYHTTSKVTVNGGQLRLFLEEDLDLILGRINQNGALDNINTQIKDICCKYLMKEAGKGNSNKVQELSIGNKNNSPQTKEKRVISPPKKLNINFDNSVTADLAETKTLRLTLDAEESLDTEIEEERNIEDCCPICDLIVTDEQKGLWCDQCNLWYHASCCDVDEPRYTELSDSESSVFKCPNCVALDESVQCLAVTQTQMAKDDDVMESSVVEIDPVKTVPVTANLGSKVQEVMSGGIDGGVKGTDLREQTITDISPGESEKEIECARKLKELAVKEKEFIKREKNLSKKEYETEHLSRQLTSAKALTVTLENRILEMKKENDNLKTHLLAAGSVGQAPGGAGIQYASVQNETTLLLRLHSVENEMLRLRLSVSDSLNNIQYGSGSRNCNRIDYNEERLRSMEEKIRSLESENKLLSIKLNDTEHKLRLSEIDAKWRQSVMVPSFFQAGYPLQYSNTPVYRQASGTSKPGKSNISINKTNKDNVGTGNNVLGNSNRDSDPKIVTDYFRKITGQTSVNDPNINRSVEGTETENSVNVNESQSVLRHDKQKTGFQIISERGSNEIEDVQSESQSTGRKSVFSGQEQVLSNENNESFLELNQSQLRPPWSQTRRKSTPT